MSKVKTFLHLAAVSAVSLAGVSPAFALDRTWIGGNSTWLDNSGAANWTGSDEPDADDRAIFNTPNSVTLGSNNLLNGLLLFGGVNLSLDVHVLTVEGGATTITGAGSAMLVTAGSTFSADSITVDASAQLLMRGGSVSFADPAAVGVLTIGLNSTVSGQGTITNTDVVGAPTSFIVNEGTISASSFGIVGPNPPSGTLTIGSSSANGRVDLDGVGGNGIVNVFRNQTLRINNLLADAFDGDINLFVDTTLDMTLGWSMTSGTIDVNNGSSGFLNPAGVATIQGGAFAQTGGVITLLDGDGTLRFDAAFTMAGGTLTNNGHVIFGANATIGPGANFTMPTTTSSITLLNGVAVNVDQANFNADGAGLTSNVITIGSGATLDLDLGVGGDTGLQGTLNLNGGELDVTTASGAWTIFGSVNVGANTGASELNGQPLSFNSTTVNIGANATLQIGAVANWTPSASLFVVLGGQAVFNAGATFSGGSFTGPGRVVLNGDTLISGNTTIATGTLDWDGANQNDLFTIGTGSTFTINSIITDAMSDRITINGNDGSLVVLNDTLWIMANTLNTNPLVLGTAFIGGTARMQFQQATWNVLGSTSVTGPLTLGTGSTVTIAAPASLNLGGNTIYNGTLVTGAGLFNPTVSLNEVAGATTINVTSFNFDRGEWRVNAGAHLTISVNNYDPDVATPAFGETITINSGWITFNSGDPAFVMDGTLNMNQTAVPLAIWDGETLQIGNDAGSVARLNIGGLGTSQILSFVRFNSDAAVTIAGGAELHLDGGAEFNSVNGLVNASFTGTGTLAFSNTITFNEATTINMVGGTIDLDGTFALGFDIQVFAPVTLNAATLNNFGKVNGVGFNRIVVDNLNGARTGLLTVNLDNPAAEWTINPEGRLALRNGTAPVTLLEGAALNMNGLLSIEGDVRVTARLDIGGTVDITTALEPLRLAGGNNTNAPNTLVGGNISGAGLLAADSNRALRGFGTINTSIDFDGNADLLADNGTLTLNGTILDVGTIGTADTDGVLNVVNPWNSSIATNVNLLGGTLTGGAITVSNGNGITGQGRVSAQVINNSRLHANVPGTLLFQTAANDNDWDGAANTGILQATNGGTLELRDNGQFSFLGTASVAGGGMILTNFGLNFEPASTLNFAVTGGTFRSTVTTDFRGAINVSGPATIQIQTNFFLTLEPTAVVTLNDNLTLVSNNAIINAGATFSGTGSIIVPLGSHLSADPNANVNVILDNRGRFRPGGFVPGRVDLRDYQQAPTGEALFDIDGTNLSDFDRMVIAGSAQLSGAINLDVGGGFVPAVGQTFNVLSASAGVTGTFALINQSGLPNNIILDVVYLPTIVQVQAKNNDIWDDSAATAVWSTGINWVDNSEPTAADGLLFPAGLGVASRTIALANVETGLALEFRDNYTFNGGTLSLTGSHPIRVQAFTSSVINSRLVSAHPVIVQGAGTLTVNPSALTTPSVHIQPSATLRLSGTASALTQPVTIAGAASAWTGRLDLAQGALIVGTANPGDKAAKIALLQDQIASGRAGGTWTGTGITSSTIPFMLNTSLALVDNADLNLAGYRGVPVGGGDLIVVQARNGDATIDGAVNAFDLNILAAHWQQPAGALWSDGDFTGDGAVNAFDLNVLAANWQFGTGGSLAAALANFPTLAAAVPEPASLLCLAGVLPILAMRRRKASR